MTARTWVRVCACARAGLSHTSVSTREHVSSVCMCYVCICLIYVSVRVQKYYVCKSIVHLCMSLSLHVVRWSMCACETQQRSPQNLRSRQRNGTGRNADRAPQGRSRNCCSFGLPVAGSRLPGAGLARRPWVSAQLGSGQARQVPAGAHKLRGLRSQ